MRILFTTHPAYGHLHPLPLLVSAAIAAGHDVAIATSALFAPVVNLLFSAVSRPGSTG